MTKFDSIYQNLLRRVMEKGSITKNQRTGHEVKALPAESFSIDLLADGFPLLSLRKLQPEIFIAEQVWFISGETKPRDFLESFTKIWSSFTNEEGVVTAAYGHRWRKHFGRDQLAELIQLLERDPSSRQGVVVSWDPAIDGLEGPKQKNVPCPFTFTVNILDGRLNLHNIMRANDLILGLPYDVAGFALLQCVLAQRLNVLPGVYTHSISYPEIYDIHYPVAEELLKRTNTQERMHLSLPKDAFLRAEQKDEALVREIAKSLTHQYQPGESIPGIQVVL